MNFCLVIVVHLVLKPAQVSLYFSSYSYLSDEFKCERGASKRVILQTVQEICVTLHRLFKEDLQLKISNFAVNGEVFRCASFFSVKKEVMMLTNAFAAIAGIVRKKVAAVPPKILSTFLSLNINVRAWFSVIERLLLNIMC